jgi:hypothetical protein
LCLESCHVNFCWRSSAESLLVSSPLGAPYYIFIISRLLISSTRG